MYRQLEILWIFSAYEISYAILGGSVLGLMREVWYILRDVVSGMTEAFYRVVYRVVYKAVYDNHFGVGVGVFSPWVSLVGRDRDGVLGLD